MQGHQHRFQVPPSESQRIRYGFRRTEAGTLVVESGHQDDAAGTLGLLESVLAEERWFVTSRRELRRTASEQALLMRSFLDRHNSCFLVGRLDERLAGFVTIQGGPLARLRHVGKLEVVVHEDSRGLGLGRMLMQAAIEWARENPFLDKLGLAVFEDNTRAIEMYESLGFVHEGRRLGEYRDPDGRYRADVLMYLWVGKGPVPFSSP